MELAIAALNARLNAGPNDIFQWARRPQTADRVRGHERELSELNRILADFGQSLLAP